ncbi:MAG: ribosome small subunit-dependent GTPase A [Candidatus Dormibacteraeota bacterium]|nr:ribosome small subunit-dependent GTPase A [Candidatus Dormibacteraeota bacterium]
MQSRDAHPLAEVGWDTDVAERFARLGDAALEPGRLVADQGARLLVHTSWGPEPAALARSLRGAGRAVAVGDWVGLARNDAGLEVRAVLERRSAIRRKVPEGESREQVLAANVDLVLIATALDGEFNERRVERLLTLAYQGGAAPLVLLTKADLGAPEAGLGALASAAPGVPALAVSAITGQGIDALRDRLRSGRTAVLLGSSGVGKSTLVNRLLGAELLRTRATHRTGHGRHTTSHRQLFPVPGGGVLIDTPGLREVQLWAGEEGLDALFADIERLELDCRFSDCRHETEPGCAVREALRDGRLDAGRWASYQKLRRELRRIETRADARARAEDLRRWKALIADGRQRARAKRGST